MSTPRYCQPGPLFIRDGQIFDSKGGEFIIQGVSWFGFEGSGGLFDGLDKSDGFGHDLDSALVRDWKVVAARIKLLGFNCIRVPFAFSVCHHNPTGCQTLFIPTVEGLPVAPNTLHEKRPSVFQGRSKTLTFGKCLAGTAAGHCCLSVHIRQLCRQYAHQQAVQSSRSIRSSRESNEPTRAIPAPVGQPAYCRNQGA